MKESTHEGGFIPAEEVRGAELWQLPSLEGAAQVVRRAADEDEAVELSELEVLLAQPPTASIIQRIRKLAQEEGFEQGRKEGHESGINAASQEIEALKVRLNLMLNQLADPIQEQTSDLAQAIVLLAGRIAESVVDVSFEYDTDTLEKIVRQALRQLPTASERVRVIMNPRDAELLERSIDENTRDWKVVADASLLSGGCIVKSEYSFVDFTRQIQFQTTVEKLVRAEFTGAEIPSDVSDMKGLTPDQKPDD